MPVLSPHTIVNFNGDTLFVDADKQIVGLDVEGIVGDNQRYANTRSKYIDNRLAKLDLTMLNYGLITSIYFYQYLTLDYLLHIYSHKRRAI